MALAMNMRSLAVLMAAALACGACAPEADDGAVVHYIIQSHECTDGTDGTNGTAPPVEGPVEGPAEPPAECDPDAPGSWATPAGGPLDVTGVDVGMDAQGNVFIAGSFEGSVSFGPLQVESAGHHDVFVAKMNTTGAFLWARSFGAQDNDWLNAATVDEAGDVIVTGSFARTVAFDDTTLEWHGTADAFVAKLDGETGDVLWAKAAGGLGYTFGYELTTGAEGAIYLLGDFNGTLGFEGQSIESGGESDVFLARLGAGGSLEWLQTFGGSKKDTGRSLGMDDLGNLLVVGDFRSQASLGPLALGSVGGSDIFLARVDPQGNVVWARSVGGPGDEVARGVVAVGDAIYITGRFALTAAFDAVTLESNGGNDIFVARYQRDGVFAWARKIGGANDEEGNGIAADEFGNVYVAAAFADSVEVGSEIVYSKGGTEALVARFNADGSPSWVLTAGSTGMDGARRLVYRDGSLLVAGWFEGSVTLGQSKIASKGGQDAFVWRIAQCR